MHGGGPEKNKKIKNGGIKKNTIDGTPPLSAHKNTHEISSY